jgi:hypothetical protein
VYITRNSTHPLCPLQLKRPAVVKWLLVQVAPGVFRLNRLPLTFKATQLDEVLENQPADIDGPTRWCVVHGAVFCSNLVVQHSGTVSPTGIHAGADANSSTLTKWLLQEARQQDFAKWQKE